MGRVPQTTACTYCEWGVARWARREEHPRCADSGLGPERFADSSYFISEWVVGLRVPTARAAESPTDPRRTQGGEEAGLNSHSPVPGPSCIPPLLWRPEPRVGGE